MLIIIYASMVVILDRAFPQLVRAAGVGQFPWADDEKVGRFYASYGFWSFPRTFFLAGSLIAFALFEFGILGQIPGAVIAVGCIIGWCIAAFRDVYRARAAAQ